MESKRSQESKPDPGKMPALCLEADKGAGPVTDRRGGGGGGRGSGQPKAESHGQHIHGKLQLQELVMQISICVDITGSTFMDSITAI